MKRRRTGAIDINRILLVLLPCAFFLPELVGYSRFAGWDITRLNLPLKWYDVQLVKQGALPLWNHYLYAGMPQLAESETGLFYPGNALLYLPGDFFYWAGLTYILHFVLAGLFMDLWLRGRGIKPPVSLLGAVLFQTAPFLLFHVTSMALLQSIVWFPLVLWLADRFVEEEDVRRAWILAVFAAFLGGMLMLVGSPQMAFYQGFLLAWYLIGYVFSVRGKWWARISRSVGLLAMFSLGAAVLGAVVWMPAREFSESTVRASMAGGGFLLGSTWLTPLTLASAFYFPAYAKQTEVIGWASSLIYVGLLPVLLAILRLTGIRLNWRRDAPLIVMGAVALFLAFGMRNPANHLLIKFPPFSLFRYQGRMALGVLVALIALASQFLQEPRSHVDGPEHEETGGNPPIGRGHVVWALGIVLLVLFAFILTVARSKPVLIGGIILVIDSILSWWAVMALNRSPELRRIPAWMAVYLVFHLIIVFPVGRLATMRAPEFREAFKFFDLVKRSDSEIPRLLVIDVGKFADRDLLESSLWAPQRRFKNLCAGNMSVFAGVQSMDPYTPMRPESWDNLIRTRIGGGFEASRKGLGVLDRDTASLLQMAGVDAVVTSGGVWGIPGYDFVKADLSDSFSEGARLFVSGKEQPRVWLSSTEPSDSGVNGFLLSEHPAAPDESVKSMVYGPNTVRLEVSTDKPTWCVVEVSYDPGWRVTLDGKNAWTLKANGIFYGVDIPEAGEYIIEFEYMPESVALGGWISGAGLVVLVILLLGALGKKT